MTVLFGMQDKLCYDLAFTMRKKGREWAINALARPTILFQVSGLDESGESRRDLVSVDWQKVHLEKDEA